MLLMKLRPLHLKGSDFGTVGGSDRIALTPGILWFSSFGWQSLPEFRYALTWFLIVAAFQSNDPFPPWGSEKYPLNATWYLWLVLSWPAGWMRCGSIRRCLDNLIFHVLEWPVDLCTMFLHLLYVQLIPRVERWRGQIVIYLILSSAWSTNAARDRTRSNLFWSPEKLSVDTTGKEFEQFESGAFYLWHQNHKNFQQETSTSSTLPYLQDLLSD